MGDNWAGSGEVIRVVESDRALIRAIAEGDRSQAEVFVRTVLPAVVGALRVRGIPSQDLDDAVQGFFARLAEADYRRLRSWQGRSSLKTWLAASAMRYAVDCQRGVKADLPLDEAAYARKPDESTPGPAQCCWLGQRRRALEAALDNELAGRPAELLRRRYYRDQSTAGIARELAMSENGVDVALNRARRRLREVLDGDGMAHWVF